MVKPSATERAPEFYSPSELAERWCGQVATQTLAQWRSNKKGPAYRKFGAKVLYELADIEAYEAKQRRC